MIVQIVEKVDNCIDCPNSYQNGRNHICRAAMKGIGSEDCLNSMLIIRNRVHELCPYKDDEVNQRAKRRTRVG